MSLPATRTMRVRLLIVAIADRWEQGNSKHLLEALSMTVGPVSVLADACTRSLSKFTCVSL
jgi:hypothetical protein